MTSSILSGLPLGLFYGARTFTLAPMPVVIEFRTVERFTGPLDRVFGRKIPDLTDSFEQWCEDLRNAAERD